MTNTLKTSIAHLYTTFARYPLRPDIDACPCCVSEDDQKKLSSKALQALESGDISRYAWKAMTTWGNVEDFKHFLPRLLELIATTGIAYDAGVVLRKLTYASWHDWAPSEQEAIRSFVFAWWTEWVTQKGANPSDFMELYQLLGELELLLEGWVIDFKNQSFRNLIHFILGNYYDLTVNRSAFKELDPYATQQLLNWIFAKKETLEQGFYYFEQIDPAFAQEISDALYQLDWVPMPNSNPS